MRRTGRSRPKLTSQHRRWNPTEIPPPDPRGWKVYYEIDPDDPPSIKEVAAAWKRNVRTRDDDSHVYYSLKTILRYVKPGNYLRVFRSYDESERREWERFVRSIRDSGVLEPVTIEIDRNGSIIVGEGNHRIAALLEIHPPYQRDRVMVPVRFYFRDTEIPVHPGLTWATFTKAESYSPEEGRPMSRHERSSSTYRGAYSGSRQSPEAKAVARKERRETSRASQAARRRKRKTTLREERRAAVAREKMETREESRSTQKMEAEQIDELMKLLF
jgi:hypothetical protein